jgi:micrococcal nuclease
VRGTTIACACSLLLVVLTGGCARSHEPALPAGQARVVRVVDGDTIVVRIDGHNEDVRLIGVDTPEEKKPNTPVECYAREAAARTSALLPAGTVVLLERDREPRDRYGRLLAYVSRVADGLSVEADLLQGGYAGTLTIAPNTARAGQYASMVNTARTGGVGLWGACGGNHVVR